MNGLFIKNIIFCLLISYNVNTFCMDKSGWQLSTTFVLDEKGDKENKVNILKFNSCGKKLAVAHKFSRAYTTYDLVTNQKESSTTLRADEYETIHSLNFTSENKLVAAGSIWQAAWLKYLAPKQDCITDTQNIISINEGFGKVFDRLFPQSADINQKCNLFAIGYGRGNISVYNYNEIEPIYSIYPYDSVISFLKFNHEGNLLACVIDFCDARIYEDGKEFASFSYENNESLEINFSPCGKFFATATSTTPKRETGPSEGTIHIYDLTTQDKKEIFSVNFKSGIRSLDFNNNSTLLLIGCSDNNMYILDIVKKTIIETIIHDSPITAVAFNPCDLSFAAGSANKVCIFEQK